MRYLQYFVVVVFLGAAASLSVAGYFSVRPVLPTRNEVMQSGAFVRRARTPTAWGNPDWVSAARDSFTSMQYASGWSNGHRLVLTTSWQFGFPCRSLRRTDEPGTMGTSGASPPTREEVQAVSQSLRAMTSAMDTHLHVVWLGTLVNTAAYSAVIGAVACLPMAFRSIRRRPGQCRRCGYEVLDLSICPECGATSDTSRRLALFPQPEPTR